jgi:hypothetical protein
MIRWSHQPKWVEKAVRQVNRQSVAPKVSRKPDSSNIETPVGDALFKRLAELVPAGTRQYVTTGVDRHVRHTGSYGVTLDARTRQKATLQDVTSTVRTFILSESFYLVYNTCHVL